MCACVVAHTYHTEALLLKKSFAFVLLRFYSHAFVGTNQVSGVALGQNEPKAHREAIAAPGRHQQDKAQAKKPRLLFPVPPFLRHRILGATFVGVAAIAKESA